MVSTSREEVCSPPPTGPSTVHKVSVVATGGCIFGLWPGLMEEAKILEPAAMYIVFTAVICVSAPFFLIFVAKCPPGGGPSKSLWDIWLSYRTAPFRAHFYGLCGGAIFQVGSECFAQASRTPLGAADAWGIGNCSPLVALLWGIFYFKEFKGVSGKVQLMFVPVVCFFLLCILFLYLAKSAD